MLISIPIQTVHLFVQRFPRETLPLKTLSLGTPLPGGGIHDSDLLDSTSSSRIEADVQ